MPEVETAPAPDTVIFRRATVEEVPTLISYAEEQIGGQLCPVKVVEDLHRHNSDTVWVVETEGHDGKRNITGFLSFLMLNARGTQGLVDGTMDTTRPTIDFIASPNEMVSGIYIWAVVARKSVGKIFLNAVQALSTPKYLEASCFAKPATFGGITAMDKYGFKKTPSVCDNLYVLERPKTGRIETPRTEYIDVRIARGFDDMAQIYAVRAAVFLGEQNCPYFEEFDGNDGVATHFLARVDGEPAATLRFRFFNGFAKMERLAVLSRFRKRRLHYKIVEAGLEHARRKGYTKFIGHAQEHALDFYAEFGFKRTQRNSPIRFSDYDYFEIMADLPPHPDAIQVDVEPMVVVRPEGAWHVAGVLDHSSSRPATNPRRPAAA